MSEARQIVAGVALHYIVGHDNGSRGLHGDEGADQPLALGGDGQPMLPCGDAGVNGHVSAPEHRVARHAAHENGIC